MQRINVQSVEAYAIVTKKKPVIKIRDIYDKKSAKDIKLSDDEMMMKVTIRQK